MHIVYVEAQSLLFFQLFCFKLLDSFYDIIFAVLFAQTNF